MTKDVGVVVLNYLTIEETEEMLVSFKKYYPQVRTLIVDNGSSPEVVSRLKVLANSYENTSVLPLEKNLGFARGHNAGINKLREEGYEYICCSNSDIVFVEGGVLEALKASLIELDGALAGPKILDLNGVLHKPTINKPAPADIRRLYHKHNQTINYRLINLLKTVGSKAKKLLCSFVKNKICKKQAGDFFLYNNKSVVFQLKGAFLMFGPSFFKHYDGFDPNTFLYGEERVLAELLFSKSLNSVYDPKCKLVHKKYKTSDLAFGSNQKIKKKHMKTSFNYWYTKYYKNI